MTTKYLSGAYPGGYTLSSRYSNLDVEATATVGGPGVIARYVATIQNDGQIDSLSLYAGGKITNGSATDLSATIGGAGAGISIGDADAHVTNFATLSGAGGSGIYFDNSGLKLTNVAGGVLNGSSSDVTALITGAKDGLYSHGYVGVLNYGTITGGGGSHDAGVDIYSGYVTNGLRGDTSAQISGYNGLRIIASYGGAINFGTIIGTQLDGVDLGGDHLTNGEVDRSVNNTSAQITGAVNGVVATTFTFKNGQPVGYDKIENFATITGSAGYGVELDGRRGSLVNGSTADAAAVISGVVGVYATSAGPQTLTNFGAIIGTGGTAVRLNDASDRLVVEAGSTFTGAVLGGGATLELADGAGTISGLAGGDVTVSGAIATQAFDDFADLEIGKPARFTLRGPGQIGGQLTVLGSLTLGGDVGGGGTLLVEGLVRKGHGAGTTAVDLAVTDDGLIETGSGTLDLRQAITGTGDLRIGAASGLEVAGAAAAGLTVTFAGAVGVLKLGEAAQFAATMAGFATGDTLDLLGTVATSASVDTADQLQVLDGTALSGDYVGASFSVTPDGPDNTKITLEAAPAAPSVRAFTGALAALAPSIPAQVLSTPAVAARAVLVASPGHAFS
jgi:hypothetical protein